MRTGRTLALVVMALLAGGVVSQLPSAMGDSENPLSALWDAIFDLQSRDDNLQAQIDELRAERDALLVQTGSEPAFVSDPYAEIEVETTEDGRTLVHITAGNGGPDRAAGVKLTAFYLMPLFEINSIDGDLCEDKSRGIIECAIGTLEEGQESVVTVDATARESGEANTWTVDISTTTVDADYTNNHVTFDFETGSGEPIEIPEVEQPVQEQEENVEPEAAEPEPEQEDSASNSTNTETEEPQESSGNQTSTETESEASGNQTSSETVDETADDSGSNSTAAESSEDVVEENETESPAEEETSDGSTSEEQPSESSETGEGHADEGVTEEQPEEQDTSGESETGESPEDGSEETSGSEIGDGGENPQ